ncbi:YihY/virulence factor BrkB family protein [Geomonas sp. RF6]|uniref:YihY/virulence factor BrkB family protein n=1 Tax=Geomonas sp. RF6 TaxID=2897342 RepID=UPI001E50434A|nr:YihY/virulence factor BrkB family protein [Geomonas sp. RF6]UFS72150.1 YihY/virulence factor BrkB family protein [Geomonas sp. RF6]
MFSFRSYFKLGDTSYKDLVKTTAKETSKDDCSTYSAAIAYYLLFALFPFLLFLTTLLGYLPIPDLSGSIMDALGRMLPGDASKLVQQHIKELFTNKQGGLLSFGFLLALWTSSSALTAIMNVMNRLYEVDEGRPFWKVRLIAMFLVVVVALFFILSLLAMMFGPQIGNFVLGIFGMGELEDWVWYIMLAPVILCMLILGVALIYHFTPDVKQSWKWISPGAVLVIPVWILASIGFSFYVNNFGSYNKTYGSIGAVIGLLMWLYITSFIILFGAEINSVVEHTSVEGKEPGEKVEGERERAPGQVEGRKREKEPWKPGRGKPIGT